MGWSNMSSREVPKLHGGFYGDMLETSMVFTPADRKSPIPGVIP